MKIYIYIYIYYFSFFLHLLRSLFEFPAKSDQSHEGTKREAENGFTGYEKTRSFLKSIFFICYYHRN